MEKIKRTRPRRSEVLEARENNLRGGVQMVEEDLSVKPRHKTQYSINNLQLLVVPHHKLVLLEITMSKGVEDMLSSFYQVPPRVEREATQASENW